MSDYRIIKNGRKWILIDAENKTLFTGKTRVSCFEYAFKNGITVLKYQHGGK